MSSSFRVNELSHELPRGLTKGNVALPNDYVGWIHFNMSLCERKKNIHQQTRIEQITFRRLIDTKWTHNSLANKFHFKR